MWDLDACTHTHVSRGGGDETGKPDLLQMTSSGVGAVGGAVVGVGKIGLELSGSAINLTTNVLGTTVGAVGSVGQGVVDVGKDVSKKIKEKAQTWI